MQSGALVTGIFLMVVVPVVFFLLIWSVVTAIRICSPEATKLPEDAAYQRRQAALDGALLPVGTTEIKEDQEHYFRTELRSSDYHYLAGDVGTLPSPWIEDLHRRRN